MNERKRNLLEDVMAYLRSYVVMTDEQKLVVALWAMHTHIIEHLEQTPYLSITSPDPECGKSRLLESLKLICAEAWYMGQPSLASLFREINRREPTILFDEIDTVFSPATARYHEDLRGIIDMGHRRGAEIPRLGPFGHNLEMFSPFCPKAFAGIGALPETVARRSIYIRLERRLSEDPVAPFLNRDVKKHGEPLHDRLAVWAEKRGEQIARARPSMPPQISDRMQEGCEPLVAIARGFGYGDAARAALVSLLTVERLDDQKTMQIKLLHDMKTIWDKRERRLKREEGQKARLRGIHTHDVIAALCRIEEANWNNYYGHDEIEPHSLAELLLPYGVRPTTVRVDGVPLKGYKTEHLVPVWRRYLTSNGDGPT